MKKHIIIFSAVLMVLACKPEVYTGVLDSPVGNWKHSWCEFYFNGEIVADLDTCEYSAISFYDNELCCIEGRKGAFNYKYSSDSLTIDSTTVWKVEELLGQKMVLKHLSDIKPIKYDTIKELQVPLEYRGLSIDKYRNGYYYLKTDENQAMDTIQCRPVSHTDEDGNLVIDFWFDSRCDTYKNF